MATQTVKTTATKHADDTASQPIDHLPEPVQLSLLGTSRLDPSLRLDLETRRRGMRHIAEIRAMLDQRRHQRLDSRDAA
jgi:hypothetical protein